MLCAWRLASAERRCPVAGVTSALRFEAESWVCPLLCNAAHGRSQVTRRRQPAPSSSKSGLGASRSRLFTKVARPARFRCASGPQYAARALGHRSRRRSTHVRRQDGRAIPAQGRRFYARSRCGQTAPEVDNGCVLHCLCKRAGRRSAMLTTEFGSVSPDAREETIGPGASGRFFYSDANSTGTMQMGGAARVWTRWTPARAGASVCRQ